MEEEDTTDEDAEACVLDFLLSCKRRRQGGSFEESLRMEDREEESIILA